MKPLCENQRDALEALKLWAENTGEIYPQFRAIQRNLARHWVHGEFAESRAAQAFAPWLEAAAKSYAKAFPDEGRWHARFTRPVRDALARDYARAFRETVEARLYDDLPDDAADLLRAHDAKREG